MNRFAHAVREELWLRGRLLESRLEHGEAFHDGDGIVASDRRDDALAAACERELERLRQFLPPDVLVRLVAEASTDGASSMMIVRDGAVSVVTRPEYIEHDLALLRRAGQTPVGAAPASNVPLLWLNGSAAVLLHECHGHPLEHGHDPFPLPEWLRVDVPLQARRASFRDVPLLRMEAVRATQQDAPFAVPSEHVAVHLAEGGSYDPLTETIAVRIPYATYCGAVIAPFELVAKRQSIRITGATGDSLRHPGVICSREGQELLVESWAPLVLTELV